MSEYQYYEFLAIDRPLTPAEMKALRDLSTRAEISSTRFTNEYHFGSFRGDPRKMMFKYFDAHVYVANWGTHQLLLRLPADALDKRVTKLYGFDEGMSFETKGGQTLIDFKSDTEEGDWEEGSEWMDMLSPIRSELLAGDLRSLYIGWLASVQPLVHEDDDDEEAQEILEPPVPAGLAKLSAAQKSLAEYLRLDEGLLATAARASAPGSAAPAGPSSDELRAFIAALPPSEKDASLLRLLEGEGPSARVDLMRRYREGRKSLKVATPPATAGRTLAKLFADSREAAEAQEREERERSARTAERRKREQAAAREAYLKELAGREGRAWEDIDAMIETRQKPEYDRAVQLLTDLRDLSQRKGNEAAFASRVAAIRAKHLKKSTLVERIDKAKLIARPPSVT